MRLSLGWFSAPRASRRFTVREDHLELLFQGNPPQYGTSVQCFCWRLLPSDLTIKPVADLGLEA